MTPVPNLFGTFLTMGIQPAKCKQVNNPMTHQYDIIEISKANVLSGKIMITNTFRNKITQQSPVNLKLTLY